MNQFGFLCFFVHVNVDVLVMYISIGDGRLKEITRQINKLKTNEQI